MVDRRSMGDALALSPDKLAFIHGEKAVAEAGRGPDKVQASDRSLDKPEPAREEPGRSSGPIRRRDRRPKVVPPEPHVALEAFDRPYTGDLPPLLVSLTTRLSPAT